jgi:protein SCO1/2
MLRLLAGVMVLIAATGCVRGSSYSFQGGELKPLAEAAPIELTDQNGQPFSLAAQEGKAVLLYFGYTTCPDACPTTLSDWVEVKRLLGDKADQVEFVMVTVDPDRDTQAKLLDYMSFFDPSFYGLTGDQATITMIEQNYGIVAVKDPIEGSATGYLMTHTTSFWVVDPDGKLRLTYALGTDPAVVAKDLEHLI